MVTGALSTLPAQQSFVPALRHVVWKERSATEVMTAASHWALVALSGLCLAPSVWMVVLGVMISPEPLPTRPPVAGIALPDFAVFDRFDPFSHRGSTQVASDVNVRVFAVRMNGPKGPSAILSVEGAPQRPFFVGDVIMPGVSLKSVDRGHVEIQTGHGQQIVEMSQSGKGAAIAAPGYVSTGLAGAGAPSGQATNALGAANGRNPASPEGAALNTARSPVGAPNAAGNLDPVKLLAEIQLVARRSQDQINGYIVLAQSEAPELAKTGLQNGDVIVEINGVPIAGGGRIEGLADALVGGNPVQVTYERAGAEHNSVLQARRE